MTTSDNSAIICQLPIADCHNSALVSIIIPAYNTGQYIYRAIESSLRQTYANIEILIVDDGSKDNTLEVAKSYAAKDERIKIFHQDNAGVSVARNYGIREAKGEYIVFLDSDDWLEDEAVEFLIEAQKKYPNMLVHVNKYIVQIDNNGNLNRYTKNLSLKSYIFNREQATAAFVYPLFTRINSPCYKIFMTDNIRSNKIYFHENISYGEDGIFVFEYLQTINGLIFINKALWNILSRPGSAVHSPFSMKKLQDNFKVISILTNYSGINTEIRNNMMTFKTFSLCNTLITLLHNHKNASLINKIKQLLKPLALNYLKNKKVPVKLKLKFILAMYFPASIVIYIQRSIDYAKSICKKLISKRL